MAIGANALAEILIELGACDGLNKKNCAQATLKMVSLGEKGRPFAARIMGDEFETFKKQWRKAFEEMERIKISGPAADNRTTKLWKDAGAEIE